MVHTALRTRNYVAVGDYFVYGWLTDDRRHMLRIMKLNEDYTKADIDVIAEIDCPSGNDGRLMVSSTHNLACSTDVYHSTLGAL